MEPLSREALLAQGSCCGNGCHNCPYVPRYCKNATLVSEDHV